MVGEGAIISGSQDILLDPQESTNLEFDYWSSSSEIIELKILVAKLTKEVNRLEHIINDMGERMDSCFSLKGAPFCDFTVILRPDDNGTYVASVPAIKGCHAWGRTLEEAQIELVNVFEMIKELYAEEGKQLPRDIDPKAFHAR